MPLPGPPGSRPVAAPNQQRPPGPNGPTPNNNINQPRQMPGGRMPPNGPPPMMRGAPAGARPGMNGAPGPGGPVGRGIAPPVGRGQPQMRPGMPPQQPGMRPGMPPQPGRGAPMTGPPGRGVPPGRGAPMPGPPGRGVPPGRGAPMPGPPGRGVPPGRGAPMPGPPGRGGPQGPVRGNNNNLLTPKTANGGSNSKIRSKEDLENARSREQLAEYGSVVSKIKKSDAPVPVAAHQPAVANAPNPGPFNQQRAPAGNSFAAQLKRANATPTGAQAFRMPNDPQDPRKPQHIMDSLPAVSPRPAPVQSGGPAASNFRPAPAQSRPVNAPRPTCELLEEMKQGNDDDSDEDKHKSPFGLHSLKKVGSPDRSHEQKSENVAPWDKSSSQTNADDDYAADEYDSTNKSSALVDDDDEYYFDDEDAEEQASSDPVETTSPSNNKSNSANSAPQFDDDDEYNEPEEEQGEEPEAAVEEEEPEVEEPEAEEVEEEEPEIEESEAEEDQISADEKSVELSASVPDNKIDAGEVMEDDEDENEEEEEDEDEDEDEDELEEEEEEPSKPVAPQKTVKSFKPRRTLNLLEVANNIKKEEKAEPEPEPAQMKDLSSEEEQEEAPVKSSSNSIVEDGDDAKDDADLVDSEEESTEEDEAEELVEEEPKYVPRDQRSPKIEIQDDSNEDEEDKKSEIMAAEPAEKPSKPAVSSNSRPSSPRKSAILDKIRKKLDEGAKLSTDAANVMAKKSGASLNASAASSSVNLAQSSSNEMHAQSKLVEGAKYDRPPSTATFNRDYRKELLDEEREAAKRAKEQEKSEQIPEDETPVQKRIREKREKRERERLEREAKLEEEQNESMSRRKSRDRPQTSQDTSTEDETPVQRRIRERRERRKTDNILDTGNQETDTQRRIRERRERREREMMESLSTAAAESPTGETPAQKRLRERREKRMREMKELEKEIEKQKNSSNLSISPENTQSPKMDGKRTDANDFNNVEASDKSETVSSQNIEKEKSSVYLTEEPNHEASLTNISQNAQSSNSKENMSVKSSCKDLDGEANREIQESLNMSETNLSHEKINPKSKESLEKKSSKEELNGERENEEDQFEAKVQDSVSKVNDSQNLKQSDSQISQSVESSAEIIQKTASFNNFDTPDASNADIKQSVASIGGGTQGSQNFDDTPTQSYSSRPLSALSQTSKFNEISSDTEARRGRSRAPTVGANEWAEKVGQELVDAIPDAEKRRQEAIYEYIETEKLFLDDLVMIQEHYVVPIKESGVISNYELVQLFSNFETIKKVSTDIYEKLLQRQRENNGLIERIGDLLVHNLPMMHDFAPFCSNIPNATQFLTEKKRSFGEFADIINKCSQVEYFGNMGLESYLLKPMQRITKLPLLVKGILRHTNSEHEDYQDIMEADRIADELLNSINKKCGELGKNHENAKIQKKLGEDLSADVMPDFFDVSRRKLIMSMDIECDGKKVMAYVFDDCFVLTQTKFSRKSKKVLLFKPIISLWLLDFQDTEIKAKMSLLKVLTQKSKSDVPKEISFHVRDIECDAVYLLSFPTEELKDKLKDCIKNEKTNLLRRSVFDVFQMKPRPKQLPNRKNPKKHINVNYNSGAVFGKYAIFGHEDGAISTILDESSRFLVLPGFIQIRVGEIMCDHKNNLLVMNVGKERRLEAYNISNFTRLLDTMFKRPTDIGTIPGLKVKKFPDSQGSKYFACTTIEETFTCLSFNGTSFVVYEYIEGNSAFTKFGEFKLPENTKCSGIFAVNNQFVIIKDGNQFCFYEPHNGNIKNIVTERIKKNIAPDNSKVLTCQPVTENSILLCTEKSGVLLEKRGPEYYFKKTWMWRSTAQAVRVINRYAVIFGKHVIEIKDIETGITRQLAPTINLSSIGPSHELFTMLPELSVDDFLCSLNDHSP